MELYDCSIIGIKLNNLFLRDPLVVSQLLINISVAQTPQPVVWTDLVGVTADGNTLTKTATSNSWNAGAASTQVIDGDGSFSVLADQTNTYRMFGLSSTNAGAGFGTIEYAMYTVGNSLYIYESGSSRGYADSFSANDILSVERVGSTVKYKLGETVIYTSTIASSGPLLADVSLYSQGAILSDAMIISNSAPEIISMPVTSVVEGTLYSYGVTATDPDGDAVTLTAPLIPGWLSFDGATLSGTPANADIGSHNVEIVATDSVGATYTQTFTIQVNGPQEFPFGANVGSAENPANLSVYGNSNLGQVILDVIGGDLGPADNVDYGTAPFLIMHDDLKIALDGDQLSSDAAPFIIQNTNPAGGITFQTGGNTTDRLTIAADGSVTIQGVTITDNNGSSVVTVPGAINASSVELPDGTTISELNDLGKPDQTLFINGDQLTISGEGGNTVTLTAGLNGNDGVDGVDGIDGLDGATWLTGSGIPDDAEGNDDDLYLETNTGDYYVKASGSWGAAAGNLTGPQGVQGPAGVDGANGINGANGTDGTDGLDGATWRTGSGIPDDAEGNDDDLYLDTNTGDYYVKASGSWGAAAGNLTGPQGVQGPAGVDGANGINGANGTDGTDGLDGTTWRTGSGIPDDAEGNDDDLYLDTNTGDYYVKASGSWGAAAGNLTGPQGVQGSAGVDGANGINGTDGTDGLDGATWRTGSGIPDDAEGNDDDLYLDTNTGDYYVKTAGAWDSPVGNLTGPQGVDGAAGVDGANGINGTDGTDGLDGATWRTGSGIPDDAEGNDDDLYLDTNTGDYYVKTAGAWDSPVGNLTGPQGVDGAAGVDGANGINGTDGTDGLDGATWRTGSGIPDDAEGNDDDLYLDTNTGDYYVKTAGAWDSPVGNLTGPQGVDGAAGVDGANGINGTDGTDGLDGATWRTGSGNTG